MARNYRLPKNYKETDIKYSVRDLSIPKATTLMQCLNVPIFGEELISHDKLRIKFAHLLQSNALQTPLFGRYKLRVSTFNCPMTNYYGFMDNNTKLSADDWDRMPHWTVSPTPVSLYSAGSAPTFDPVTGLSSDPLYLLPLQYQDLVAKLGGYWGASGVVPYGYVPYFRDAGKSISSQYPADSPIIKYLQVQPGSLLDYMGLPPGYFYNDGADLSNSGLVESVFNIPLDNVSEVVNYTVNSLQGNGFMKPGGSFNAHFIISYLDCVRTYLVNKQLAYGVYMVSAGALNEGDIETNVGTMQRTGNIPVTIPLAAIDEFFIWLRSQQDPRDLMLAVYEQWFNFLNSQKNDLGQIYLPTFNREHWSAHILVWLSTLRFGGLFCCQYESDMLQNLLTDVEGAESFVEVVDGKFSINEFRYANRRQRRRERVAISGGRYKDLLRALWNAKSRSGVDVPDFINTSSVMIDPRNIISSADTETPDASGKALGQMAGNVNSFNGRNPYHVVHTEDPSQLMMIVSLVPEIMYSDGIDKNLLSLRFSDDYSPQFDQVGFQDVPNILYNALPRVVNTPDRLSQGEPVFVQNGSHTVRTVGKNVAWNRYLSNVGRVHGRFVRGFDYDSFVLTRDYRYTVDFDDDSTPVEYVPNGYAIPNLFQYPFIIQESDFPNWFFQIDIDIRATRAIGKNYMPTLGK